MHPPKPGRLLSNPPETHEPDEWLEHGVWSMSCSTAALPVSTSQGGFGDVELEELGAHHGRTENSQSQRPTFESLVFFCYFVIIKSRSGMTDSPDESQEEPLRSGASRRARVFSRH